jgi:hypothetical protein
MECGVSFKKYQINRFVCRVFHCGGKIVVLLILLFCLFTWITSFLHLELIFQHSIQSVLSIILWLFLFLGLKISIKSIFLVPRRFHFCSLFQILRRRLVRSIEKKLSQLFFFCKAYCTFLCSIKILI